MPNPENLTPFSKTYQPKNPGRKPSYMKKWLKKNNVGTADIRLVFSNILLAKNVEQMKAIIKDPKTPPLVAFLIGPMLRDAKAGRTTTIQWLTQYAYGMPKQEIESINLNADLDSMPKAERSELLKVLVDKFNSVCDNEIQGDDETDEDIINT
jgi:hypothetical protein